MQSSSLGVTSEVARMEVVDYETSSTAKYGLEMAKAT
jgi:hypothetical protein